MGINFRLSPIFIWYDNSDNIAISTVGVVSVPPVVGGVSTVLSFDLLIRQQQSFDLLIKKQDSFGLNIKDKDSFTFNVSS